MIAAIVVSRDRPAQLDLCLRSLALYGQWIDGVRVIWKATSEAAHVGYHTCAREHEGVLFVDEGDDFRATTLRTVARAGLGLLMFVTDDDVMIDSPYSHGYSGPGPLLHADHDLLCVSLRLGANTKECYSLRKTQHVPAIPESGVMRWPWRGAEGDFSYPGSLDGHIFRSEQLHILISANWPDWKNPNELEDHLSRGCETALLPRMACYRHSCLVGVPVNRVGETHKRNRWGEKHPAPTEDLIYHYNRGYRLALDTIDASKVNAAHVEFPLAWEKNGRRMEAA